MIDVGSGPVGSAGVRPAGQAGGKTGYMSITTGKRGRPSENAAPVFFACPLMHHWLQRLPADI
jgi:hypothetical protein